MRLRIDLAYDGTEFHGWAAQPGLRTVQGTLEAALGTVLRTPVMVACAGRTDAGVHARGQVTHVDVPAEHAPDDPGRLTRRLNGVLPADVRVVTAGPAPDGFDARFSALWRRYAYRIADPQARPDPLTRAFRLTWPRPLAEEAMNAAATSLLGEHDFAAFCRRREGATTIRRLLELSSSRDSTGSIVTTVRADAFCHNMVRSLIGCLIAVGEGRRDPEWAGSVLSAAVRDPAVTVVPPQGLVLEEVAYPPDEELAERAAATRVVRSLPVAVPGGSGGPDG